MIATTYLDNMDMSQLLIFIEDIDVGHPAFEFVLDQILLRLAKIDVDTLNKLCDD
jgi:hypothetical protein